MRNQENITEEPISKELETRVREKLIQARVGMLWTQPFFGTLAMRLQIQAADQWLPTAAVDGKYFYFNHKFIDSLDADGLIFLFSHEILHLCYDHLGRLDDRNPKLFNVAADYVVNDELVVAGVGKMPHAMVEKIDSNGRKIKIDEVIGLHDVKYRGWNSEKVYDDLLKNMQKQNSNKSGSGDVSLDSMLDKLLDDHLNSRDGEETTEGSGSDKEGNGKPSASGPAKLSEDEKKQLKSELKDQIINAAKNCSAGNLPGGIKRIIQELTEPKMDWRSLLQCQLDSIIPADYSFMKVSRTGWDIDAVLPGLITDQELKIAVAIDMSGSIGTKEAQDFLSEVNGIMQQFQNYEILVFCYDSAVHNPQVFSSDNGEDIRTYQPMGGGGTSYEAIYEYLEEEGIVPLRLVNFTDGYPNNTWGNEFYCDTTFIIKGSREVPPFGQYAYMDD
jgi:predicted metal-dependent peptidase